MQGKDGDLVDILSRVSPSCPYSRPSKGNILVNLNESHREKYQNIFFSGFYDSFPFHFLRILIMLLTVIKQ